LGTEPGGWETGHVSMWTWVLRAKRKKEKEWRELLGRLPDGWIFRDKKVVYLFRRKWGKRFTDLMTD
jgi:hypothetical protein